MRRRGRERERGQEVGGRKTSLADGSTVHREGRQVLSQHKRHAQEDERNCGQRKSSHDHSDKAINDRSRRSSVLKRDVDDANGCLMTWLSWHLIHLGLSEYSFKDNPLCSRSRAVIICCTNSCSCSLAIDSVRCHCGCGGLLFPSCSPSLSPLSLFPGS